MSPTVLLRMAQHGACADLSVEDVKAYMKRKDATECLHCHLGNFPQFPVGRQVRDKHEWQVGESFSVDIVGKYEAAINGITYYYLARDKVSGFLIEDYAKSKKYPIRYLEYLIGRVRTAGHNLKIIHFDADTIFESNEVEMYLITRNIEAVYSLPGEHRKSGAIEVMIRIVNTRARTLMLTGKVPTRF